MDEDQQPQYKPPSDPNKMACEVLKRLIKDIEDGRATVKYIAVSNDIGSFESQRWTIETAHPAFNTTVR